MFEKFRHYFIKDNAVRANAVDLKNHDLELLPRNGGRLTSFLEEFDGASFNRGLYRVLDIADILPYTARISTVFPNYEGRICPFAYDWLNRIYSVDISQTANTQPMLHLFSHLTDEVFELPFEIATFHNEVLTNRESQVLDSDMFDNFLASARKKAISRSQCVAMRVPLFLGGTYCVENMEIIDSKIDWEITAQLLNETRTLQSGTVISSVSLAEKQ